MLVIDWGTGVVEGLGEGLVVGFDVGAIEGLIVGDVVGWGVMYGLGANVGIGDGVRRAKLKLKIGKSQANIDFAEIANTPVTRNIATSGAVNFTDF